ncbi:PREDICTED: villin-1 isoform X2 [Nicrophorus vespilloides]|uniref:Villin-1 isoform X2 n=1 Tax=Nicrophorus vespilloides TaxID=110193 RepID=A0ABM1M5A1_NICVS|nr:PREDICTED: villin-1 isoform X2 [Nicrophorus vespilloides]
MKKDDADGFSNGTSNGMVDAAFRKIQRNCTGFHIWRIENMNVVALPKDNYGTFYDADSYIVYASSQQGASATIDTVCREVKGPIEIHIHFWLGSSTSAEKSGAAAYKTVELDGYLSGVGIQHRETQGNESPRFKSYFKNGIRILKGGTNTPLREIINNNHPKLYKIKGRRTPILTQLNSISWSHFNSGDAFLVQTEKVIFVWIGRAANAVEKLHSAKIANQLKTETGIQKITFIDDGYEQTMSASEKSEFQCYLPLDKRHVLPPNHDSVDEEYEKSYRSTLRLYRCTDSSGKYRVTEIKGGPLLQTDLESDDVYIIDHGIHGIWVWVGKRASDKERVEAMRNARGFVKKKKYPNNTSVTRVVEGSECLEFKMLFLHWTDRDACKGKSSIAKRVITKFDALTMSERPALAAETQLVDDGSGSIMVWRIKGNDAIEIPKERYGHFFSGDCYIVWYNYNTSSIRHIVFYWLGLNAHKQEIKAAELKANEVDKQLEGVAVQIRMVQSKEPAQFLQLFKGKMITYKGEGTDYDESGRNLKHPSNYLLQIHGSTSFSSKATQVNYKANALNSNYCFVLKKGKHYFIWCGNTSTGDQREMAKHFTGKDFEIILEGKEPNEFWDLLGGKTAYTTSKMLSVDGLQKPARLFQCSSGSGKFRAEELFNFSQSDLVPEDVMLLDAHDTIFVWIGKLSTKEESRLSLELAKDYLKSDPSGKDVNTPIVIIRQGNEPPNFTGFFKPWDENMWKSYKCFDDVRQELQGGEIIPKPVTGNSYGEEVFDRYDKYPISILKGPSEKLPSKVDPLAKELHLTHDDFVYLFKMQYREFENLPRWKQQELKKKVGLF